MSQGSNPAAPIKIVTSPSAATIVFDGSGSSQGANYLSTVTASAPAQTVDASSKLPVGTSVHGAIQNNAGVSIIFSSDGK